jgi:hypothetical protein
MSKAAQDAVEKLGGKVNILVAANTDEAPNAKKATKAETAEQPAEDNASDETTDEATD